MKNKNLKRGIKFILFMIICGIIGGILGYSSINFLGKDFVKYQLENLANLIFVIIIIFAILQVGIFIYCSNCRRKIKNDNYDNKESSVYEKIGMKNDLANGIGTTLGVTAIPLIMLLPILLPVLSLPKFFFLLGVLLFVCLVNTVNEISMIKTLAKVQPDKDVDWSKLNLNKLAYENLDECEKVKLGVVGAKLITTLHFIFSGAFLLCTVLSFFFQFSGMEFIILALLWGVFTLLIVIENYKTEKS